MRAAMTGTSRISRARVGLARGITRNVFMLGLVSLLTDVSSEMLVYVVPLFLANVLAAGPAVIGIIEGVANSAAGILQFVSGRISDRAQRRQPLVAVGYSASVVGKALFLAAGSWPIVLLARLGDRLGKGLRTAPRDALIGDSTDPRYRGRAFGLHRAMDTAGAFLGVLVAVVVIGATQAGATQLDANTFNTLVLLALVPGIFAVLVVVFGVRDVQPTNQPAIASAPDRTAATSVARLARLRAQAAQLPRAFWLFVGADIVFTLGNSSDAFLALRTQTLGVAVEFILLMILAFNLANALVSWPAGALSDRFGRRAPIALAWAIYALTYAGFALADSPNWAALLWIVYGIHTGIAVAVGRALVADVAPIHLRATGYGILNAGESLALLPASVVAGLLWAVYGASAPFWFGAACALVATVLLFFVRPARAQGSSATT
jgi:MFS family permease